MASREREIWGWNSSQSMQLHIAADTWRIETRSDSSFYQITLVLVFYVINLSLSVVDAWLMLCMQLAAVNNCIVDWRIALTGHMVAQIVIELTICAIHPPPGTCYFYADLVRYCTNFS